MSIKSGTLQPDVEREHLELSNGQLRTRVRAYERELAAAPRYVANELAGTRQAAARHEHDAVLRRAEAANTTDPAEQERLTTEAGQAEALARTLAERAEQLQQVDDARARWLLHSAATRTEAELSKAELTARGADDDPDDQVTATEWMAAHHAAQAEDDDHRDITETDVVEGTVADERVVDVDEAPEETQHTEWRDLRAVADEAPATASEDVVRVPTADEAADSVAHAGRVLDEITYRDALDADDAEHEYHQEAMQWHEDDQAAQQHDAVEDDDAELAGL